MTKFEIVERPSLYSNIPKQVGQTMRITFPWCVSVNAYWQHSRTGHTFLSKKARRFRTDCQALFLEQHGIVKPMLERVRVVIVLRCATARIYDLDNFNKGILDGLKYCKVVKDDCQIDDLRVVRGEQFKGGRVEILIEEIA